ncbi:alpha/beta hydrolase [Arthrobacter humicola]|jgi:acetyl esterase/lipase|uniref:alpha/beta hydrolase n=1 Tax=Arthrobacter humicola TaxID=409291 RepID=UPI001FACCE0B|nr:alpha/beta hydrolase [Arthrobacter humicola]MCI9870434.1 alpha/beta hydrolase [Arthrobacter humicola]
MPITTEVSTAVHNWSSSLAALPPLLRGEPSDTTLDELRTAYDEMLAAHPTPEGVTIEEVDMGGIPGIVVTPETVEDNRALFYIHGGAYIVGSPAGYHGLAGNFAVRLNARVFLPHYRLAPEHPFPTPINDTVDAYRWLLEQGQDPKRLMVAGDSAGGAMTVTVMIKARNLGLPLPAAGVALSPWANLEHTGASMTNREGLDPLNSKAVLDLLARSFLGGALPNDPDASPVFADVRGLPPILVTIGENELMLSDAVRLAGHLAENRVRVSLDVWPEMFHVWHMHQDRLPEGRKALDDAARFLLEALPAR